jgi:hypothetical protein
MAIFVDLGELEAPFRKAAMKKYGYSKGAIRNALSDAVRAWFAQDERRGLPRGDDPVDRFVGIARGYAGRKTSAELKHEAARTLARG